MVNNRRAFRQRRDAYQLAFDFFSENKIIGQC